MNNPMKLQTSLKALVSAALVLPPALAFASYVGEYAANVTWTEIINGEAYKCKDMPVCKGTSQNTYCYFVNPAVDITCTHDDGRTTTTPACDTETGTPAGGDQGSCD